MDSIDGELVYDNADEAYTEEARKALVECICPKCRERHFMKIHWIGEFTPWKYCKQCRNIISNDV